jgi:hypothetical protein
VVRLADEVGHLDRCDRTGSGGGDPYADITGKMPGAPPRSR